MYVPPEDDVADPPELPPDELTVDEPLDRRVVVVRRGDEVDVAAGAGATRAGACACSTAEIESSVAGLGDTARALSTGRVSVFEQAALNATSAAAATTITFFIVFPFV